MTADERTDKLLLEIAETRQHASLQYASVDFLRYLETRRIYMVIESLEARLHDLVNRGALIWEVSRDDVRYRITNGGIALIRVLQRKAMEAV